MARWGVVAWAGLAGWTACASSTSSQEQGTKSMADQRGALQAPFGINVGREGEGFTPSRVGEAAV